MFTILVDPNIGIHIQGLSVILNVFCCTKKKRGFQANAVSVDASRACVQEMLYTCNGTENDNNKRLIFVKDICCIK